MLMTCHLELEPQVLHPSCNFREFSPRSVTSYYHNDVARRLQSGAVRLGDQVADAVRAAGAAADTSKRSARDPGPIIN